MWLRFVIKDGNEEFVANMINLDKAIRVYHISLGSICNGSEGDAPYTLVIEFPNEGFATTKQYMGLFKSEETLVKFWNDFWERLSQEENDFSGKTYGMTVEYDIPTKPIPEIMYNIKLGIWVTRKEEAHVD